MSTVCIALQNYVSPQGIPCPNAVVVIPQGVNVSNPRPGAGLPVAVYYTEAAYKAGNSPICGYSVKVSLAPNSTLDEAYSAVLAAINPPIFAGASLVTS